VKWHLCSLYADTAATKQLSDIVDRTQSADAAGVRAYQLRQVLETTPNDPVLLYHLADAQRVVGQDKEGEANYLAALHNDAGRTNLSQLALVRMAEAMTKQGREMQAIHCLAAALSLDVDCPTTNRLLLPLLEKNGFPEQAQKLKAQATSRPSSVRGLPGLTSPDPKATALAGDKLYAAAVESVVLVERGDASGSGVCVARGVIVTNDHVISGRGDIRVTPFQLADGKLKRLEAMTATVLYESQELDVAVLEVKSAPASLKPLPVATANPKAGEKIYALGSPGLGDQVLEQSISEGLVSAPSRTLEGRSYLQHSAAINPGNSGGPLLNQRGEVVGINTLVAKLNNVGFAIPPEVIRKVFQTK
jgi:S1-C subfamily serine protease